MLNASTPLLDEGVPHELPASAVRPDNPLSRFLDGVARVALWLAAIALVLLTAIVGWQVFARYVLNDTPSWAEPLALQLMSWLILLGAAVGVRERFHLGLDLLRHILPTAMLRVMDMISMVAVSVFGGCMTWFGIALARGTWNSTIPVLGLPGGVVYFPLTLGGVLVVLFALERLILLRHETTEVR
ncbi:TRAP transporter small permease [Marinivivus vitaminiproducens]|uniref:TRAP transporter small permease n=1 Tax=Marinivivus vitaminiproducens TaxID=3035935 RepID=UPI00279AC022|nr:TRAP transporter small permease [Geminicoccaceae bacterium SCSIO 64248]